MTSLTGARGARARLALITILVLALVVAGCAGQTGAFEPGTTAPEVGLTDVAPTVAAEPTMAAEPTVAAEPMVDATAVTTDTMSGPATVMTAVHEDLGEILVDAEGMTLYLFTNDTENTSNCYNQCAVNWPPLLTSGDPEAGEGVDEGLLGTTSRTDGTTQVTYNGWPLYYWISDTNPGDATGQGVGDVWYVVSPEGEMIEN